MKNSTTSSIAGGGDFLAHEQQQSFLTRGRNLSAQLNHMHFYFYSGWLAVCAVIGAMAVNHRAYSVPVYPYSSL
jgi:hypothetical protein